jgi:protein tyrosine/serine phosphatase
MAQHVLGVSREAIMDDYLLTNSAGNIEARIEAGAVQIRERHGAISDETIRALMGVEADYLNAAFQAVETRYGSLDTYLAEVLGIDAAKREALRGHYLEG